MSLLTEAAVVISLIVIAGMSVLILFALYEIEGKIESLTLELNFSNSMLEQISVNLRDRS